MREEIAASSPSTIFTQADLDELLALARPPCEGWIERLRGLVGTDAKTWPQAWRDAACRWASKHGRSKSVERLLAAGVSPGGIDSACVGAAAGGYTRIVELLLAAGVSPFVIDAACVWAAASGRAKIVSLLLAARAKGEAP